MNGASALCSVAAVWAFVVCAPRRLPRPTSRRTRLPALGLIIIIYGVAYLRLPDQAGYLIPIIPAALLLAARFAPPVCFRLCCLCLTISPLLEVDLHCLQAGAVFHDRSERLTNLRNISSCIDFAETLPGQSVIVVGAWEPEIAVLAPDLPTLRNRYVYLLSPAEITKPLQSGERIFYLPAVRSFAARVNGVDLARCGLDLFALYQARAAVAGDSLGAEP